MRLGLPISAALDRIEAYAALECLPFVLRVGRAPDKGHLPAALRAQQSIVGTMGVGLLSGHNSPREFQCLCAVAT
jgi:hypothetical protein